MKLVEVVRSPSPIPASTKRWRLFAASLGKTPVRASDKTGSW
jgi:3-hydroxyacyl-CoA dehydrogenase